MSVIKQLSSFVASQIAAGEVVERPASLVKELIENSIDAKAKNVKITIENAGATRISITDDGSGIAKDDLVLALSRHATSKIDSINDLSAIYSFGFRGEALASAAAVSRLTLSSKAEGADSAWQISTLDVNQQKSLKSIRHNQGTTIDVYDLFFNTPARKLFLKSERTEFSYIEDIFKAFAIIRPDISFELIHNNKVVKKLATVGEFKELEPRLKALISTNFTNGITYSEFSGGQAWFAHPSYSRNNSDQQWLFVNQRLIKDAGLAHAVKRAYQDVMMVGRQPAFILSLTIEPDLIDVNIHPSKKEIKFVNKEEVYKSVFYAARAALLEATTPKAAVVNEIKIPEPIFEPKAFEFKKPVNNTVINTPTEVVTAVPKPITKPVLGYAIAQIKGAFIISETEAGIVLVDMHAAHERIRLEQLKKQYKSQGVVKQKLIQPISLEVKPEALDVIEKKSGLINQFGFEIEQASDSSVFVRAIPALLKNGCPETLLLNFLDELIAKDPSSSIEQQVNKILATIGCHSAIRANRSLSIPEMNSLLRQMEQTEFAEACNHGRPTYKKISSAELDALFARGK